MLLEAVFFLVLLKIPVVYLCVVVWWAIRAEPSTEPPLAPVTVSDTPSPDPLGWAPRASTGRRGAGRARAASTDVAAARGAPERRRR